MPIVNKPWGNYTDIHRSKEVCLKTISVFPNSRPSLQIHENRDEIWVIQQGNALVTLDGSEFEANQGDIIRVSRGQKHRIKNLSDSEVLVFIELQIGICEEEDIVRLEDDYSRTE